MLPILYPTSARRARGVRGGGTHGWCAAAPGSRARGPPGAPTPPARVATGPDTSQRASPGRHGRPTAHQSRSATAECVQGAEPRTPSYLYFAGASARCPRAPCGLPARASIRANPAVAAPAACARRRRLVTEALHSAVVALRCPRRRAAREARPTGDGSRPRRMTASHSDGGHDLTFCDAGGNHLTAPPPASGRRCHAYLGSKISSAQTTTTRDES